MSTPMGPPGAPSGGCCSECVGEICVTAKDSCSSSILVNGVTIGISLGGTSLGSCVTSGYVSSVNITNNGTGYTSAPTVAIAGGGGSGASGTAAISGGQVTGVTITAGGSGYTGNPGITFSGGGGHSAAGTVAATNACCVSITSAETYTVSWSNSGDESGTTTIAATCSTNNLNVSIVALVNLQVKANDCTGNGTTSTLVTVKAGGATVATGNVNAAGTITFGSLLTVGTTYTVSASDPNNRDQWNTATITPGTCAGTVTANLDPVTSTLAAPQSGYACSVMCGLALTTTLYVVDSRLGVTTTLTYAAPIPGTFSNGWYGSTAHGADTVRYQLFAYGVGPGYLTATSDSLSAGTTGDIQLPSTCPPAAVMLNFTAAGTAAYWTAGDAFAVHE